MENIENMVKRVFVTGASGFLGKEVLAGLIANRKDMEFHLLVRSQDAKNSIQSKIKDDNLRRIRFVDGDVEQGSYELPSRTDKIFHLAASTNFEEVNRTAIKSMNVSGTEKLVEKALKSGVNSFAYVCTAYSAGLEKGVIPEDTFNRPSQFKNPYEESKWEAEQIVRQARFKETTIMRPSIIMGDSKTFNSYGDNRGYYGYIGLLYRAAVTHFGGIEKFLEYFESANTPSNIQKMDVRLVGNDDTTKNIVPIDYVSSAIVEILSQIGKTGKTYNLVNGNLTMREATDEIESALHVQRNSFRYVPSLAREEILESNKAEFKAHRDTFIYWPYTLNGEPTWQTDNARSLHAQPTPMTKELFGQLARSKINEYNHAAKKKLARNDAKL